MDLERYGARIKNDHKVTKGFRFREPAVLLQIVCLSLLRGIIVGTNDSRFYSHIKGLEYFKLTGSMFYYSILQFLAPLPAIVLMTFISEINGRKPVFYVLFTLSMLSSILSYVPHQQPWVKFEDFFVAVLKGGVLPITALAICEYSGPKHRFAYLMANELAKVVGTRITRQMYDLGLLSAESSYLSLCTMLVALACVVLVRWWPESPYWLAQRGRREQAVAAFTKLRGEGAASRELRALDAARLRPSPKLFLLSLFFTFVFISVAKCSMSLLYFSYNINHDLQAVKPQSFHYIINACICIVVLFVIVLVSYKVKRKLIYFGASIIPFALTIIISIWVYSGQVGDHPVAFYCILLINCIFLECGPFSLSLVLFIELTPQKYYTYISCISSLYFISSTFVYYSVPMKYLDILPLQGFLLVFVAIALAGVAFLYWASPEIENKNLFEIEEIYYRKLYNINQEDVQLENLAR